MLPSFYSLAVATRGLTTRGAFALGATLQPDGLHGKRIVAVLCYHLSFSAGHGIVKVPDSLNGLFAGGI